MNSPLNSSRCTSGLCMVSEAKCVSPDSPEWENYYFTILRERRDEQIAAYEGMSRETPGTCSVSGCFGYRGPSRCSAGKCICEPGYCFYKDSCRSLQDLKLLGEDAENLEAYKKSPCLQQNMAPANSDLPCASRSGSTGVGSCKFWGCDTARGPVDCIWGSCKCKADTCAVWDYNIPAGEPGTSGYGHCVDHDKL